MKYLLLALLLASCGVPRYLKDDIVIVNGATGFKMDKYIVSCFHVVKKDSLVEVTYYQEKKPILTSVVAVDSLNDIVLLSSPDYKEYEVGEPNVRKKVFSIGHPMQLYWSEIEGTVQSVERDLDGRNLIQVSMDSYFGFSGSPVFDSEGKLIGMGSLFIPGTRFTLIVPIQKIVALIKKTKHHEIQIETVSR